MKTVIWRVWGKGKEGNGREKCNYSLKSNKKVFKKTIVQERRILIKYVTMDNGQVQWERGRGQRGGEGVAQETH